jgi:DNA topoisomerase-1
METNLDKIEEGIEWQSVIRDFYPDFNKSLLDARKDHSNMKLKDEVSEVKCEKCGSMMIVKDGKYGKFLACPNYPDCKNIKPYGEIVGKCPKCQSDVYKKKSKTGKIYFACSKCDFKSWDKPAPFLCPQCGSCVKEVVKNDEKFYQCTSHFCTFNEKEKENEN